MAMTDDDKAYIKSVSDEARRILREDRILAKLNKVYPDAPDGGDQNDGKPKPPPAKNPPAASGEDKKPRNRWWGESADE
jgi:hypothetical protein